MKRALDLFFGILIVIVILPVLATLALCIKFTSKGNIIFKQRRIGKDGAEFAIYKFRTMYSDAPKNVPTHMLENPHAFITPVGKFLRKTSLDELPQIFNVIEGNMSFVGPRPALYNQYDLIALRDEFGINKMLPGITGWAQVNGRDELPIPKKVEFDRYYLENKSLILDAKIIFMTIFNVVSSKNVVEGKAE